MNKSSLPEPDEKYNILDDALSIVAAVWDQPQGQPAQPAELQAWLCHSCLRRTKSNKGTCCFCGTAKGGV